jgi:hypothetical protein
MSVGQNLQDEEVGQGILLTTSGQVFSKSRVGISKTELFQ